MLYLFHGTDAKKSREKVRALVGSLIKREPDAGSFRIDGEFFTEDTLVEYVSGAGLFSKRYIVVLDNLFESDDAQEVVLRRLKDLGESKNVFILLEGKLDAATLKKVEKLAEKSQKSDLKTNDLGLRTDFNIFSLTDALGSRDRKKLWVLYQKALQSGAVPEEIHGILFWQVKTMLLVIKKSTGGLKPFVISKAKRFLENYTGAEVEKLSADMVRIYHDARQGGSELSLGLEQLILNL